MGFSVTLCFDSTARSHFVNVNVALTLAETNNLFLSGDTIISWPEGEVRTADVDASDNDGSSELRGDRGLPRTSMFVSELARLARGLQIGYRQAAEAERVAQLVRLQLVRAGIEEVS
jgi:hypothetical protein